MAFTGALLASVACWPAPSAAEKVLRMEMPTDIEVVDPARAGDLTTLYAIAPVFHQLLAYDYLASPVKLIPYAAEALPAVSADRRTYTFRIRPGLLFAPHPAFGGKPRELTADDFVYSFKRLADPALSSMSYSSLEGRIEGLEALVSKSRREGSPFDYAAAIAGLRAPDRRTLEIRLTRPDPTFIYTFAYPGTSAVPREVVKAEGAEFARRAVGSGPYRIARFQPGTRLDFVKNPAFKPLPWTFFTTVSKLDDPETRALQDATIPLIDRIEMIRIAEPGPALLALSKGEIDFLTVRQPVLAFDGAALKPELQAKRIRATRGAGEGFALLMFNMRDPVVGGLAPAQVALRRAIAMSIDDPAWLQVFDRGLGRVRQHLIGPGVVGHDPAYRNPNGHDPATASALLDRMGYARAADGYRRTPDGRELELRMIIGTTSLSRELAEFLKRAFDQLGLRIVFDAMPVGDRLKRMSTCQYQITTMNFGGGAPDGVAAMENFYSPHIGTVNLACYKHDAYDQAYERLRIMPLDAARASVFRELTALIDAHAPSRVLPMADTIYLLSPKIRGYVLNDYLPYPYHLIDIVGGAPAPR